MKKISMFLIALSLVSSLLPFTSFAEKEVKDSTGSTPKKFTAQKTPSPSESKKIIAIDTQMLDKLSKIIKINGEDKLFAELIKLATSINNLKKSGKENVNLQVKMISEYFVKKETFNGRILAIIEKSKSTSAVILNMFTLIPIFSKLCSDEAKLDSAVNDKLQKISDFLKTSASVLDSKKKSQLTALIGKIKTKQSEQLAGVMPSSGATELKAQVRRTNEIIRTFLQPQGDR